MIVPFNFLSISSNLIFLTLPKMHSTSYSKFTIHLFEIWILILMAYLSSQKYFNILSSIRLYTRTIKNVIFFKCKRHVVIFIFSPFHFTLRFLWLNMAITLDVEEFHFSPLLLFYFLIFFLSYQIRAYILLGWKKTFFGVSADELTSHYSSLYICIKNLDYNFFPLFVGVEKSNSSIIAEARFDCTSNLKLVY